MLAFLVRRITNGFLLLALIMFALEESGILASKFGLRLTSLGDVWTLTHRASLEAVQAFVLTQAPALNEGFLSLLRTPAWLAVGLIGIFLYLTGRSRRPRPSAAAATTNEVPGPTAQPKSSFPKTTPHSELRSALTRCRGAFVGIGLFSGMSNILMLTGSFYMLEVYDRVLPSRSVPTLVALSVLTAFLFMFQGLIDLIRGRLLVRIAASLDEALSSRVYDCIVQLPLKAANRADGLQPLRDLDSVRSFLSGVGPLALFDIPWMPLYLGIIFAFHPLLGITATAGAIVLVMLTATTEILTRTPTKTSTIHAMARNGLADTSRRNAEVLIAMGMARPMGNRWSEANRRYMSSQRRVSDLAGGLGAISKILRLMLQSAMLGLGAYLVLHQEATAGIIIAGAILTSRALAPVDLAIANWRGFIGARQSWQRLTKLLTLLPPQSWPMQLPAPRRAVSVENVSVAPPGTTTMTVQDVAFALQSGQGLGIIGPSASGKSSFARALVGVWPPARGKIRLDGAALDQWPPEALGCHVGYLPQDVELFGGTVAENIARFDPKADPEGILAAAQAAGVHDLITNLTHGYETDIGEQGSALSAGQQQRVALARALYGNPFLVVLDEPNSNLDAEGETALTHAILGIRARGGVVVVIAHRPTALAGVDMVLVMAKGRQQAFGPKDEVLAKMVRPAPPPIPFKVIPERAG